MPSPTKYGTLFDDNYTNIFEDVPDSPTLSAVKAVKDAMDPKSVVLKKNPMQVEPLAKQTKFSSKTKKSNFLVPSPSQKEYTQEAAPILQNSTENLIFLEFGLTSPHGKVIGGRGNKEKIPKQQVALNAQILPSNYTSSKLVANAHLYGHRKSDNSPIQIDTLESNKPFILEEETWRASFNDITIRHSSHNNGQRLFIRFFLFDLITKTTLYQCDSSLFETITKRGMEKKRKKNDFKENKSNFKTVNPNVVPITGGTLVKITGSDFLEVPARQVVVKFGDFTSGEVVCVNEDLIICETPQISQAKHLDVTISYDAGSTFISTGLQVNFVSKTKSGIEMIMKLFCQNTEPLLKKIKF
eukprot:gene1146-10660_t